ncbi:MAG: pyruvate kinase [Acidobacteriia bacterium]|nr:pyruvate kinase [Terriglobia bacterium]
MGSRSTLRVWNKTEVRDAMEALADLRADMVRLESRFSRVIRELRSDQRSSATNLVHYLALRGHDLRKLQKRLAEIGVSSLGRSEGHILDDVDRVLEILRRLHHAAPGAPSYRKSGEKCTPVLKARTEALLGPTPVGRNVRILVTAPSEAATNYELIHRLLQNGMNCLRINCAYDTPEAWGRMIANLHQAQEELDKPCNLLMDIAGPKLRIGPIEPGPRVMKVRPRRDVFGRIESPARLWLTPNENRARPPAGADGCLNLDPNWLASCAPGDSIHFKDARGSGRTMSIVAAEGANRWAELSKTAYITPETDLHLQRRGEGHLHDANVDHVPATRPLDIPAHVQCLVLRVGDTLILTRTFAPGHPAIYDEQGRLLSPATVSLTLPEIFDQVKPGEPIWFDDGKIGGAIRTVDFDAISVEITHASPEGSKLEADKGINAPESELRLPPLTSNDQRALEFIAKHADMVGYSFVRDAHGIRELQRRLADLGGEHVGIILKIETRKAFESLPDLLLAAMHGASVGVMIARGDLAIECGFERLAEVQEEILWFAEAAHVPVIWATQVLERLAKDGIPSRAEITDAAMASRAECVMLNKGPYIVDALRSLDDILRRMETHQAKKSSMMRSLKIASNYRAMPHASISVINVPATRTKKPRSLNKVRTARAAKRDIKTPSIHKKGGSEAA